MRDCSDPSLFRAWSDCRPYFGSYGLHLLCRTLHDSRSFHFRVCGQIFPPAMRFRCILCPLSPQTSHSCVKNSTNCTSAQFHIIYVNYIVLKSKEICTFLLKIFHHWPSEQRRKVRILQTFKIWEGKKQPTCCGVSTALKMSSLWEFVVLDAILFEFWDFALHPLPMYLVSLFHRAIENPIPDPSPV